MNARVLPVLLFIITDREGVIGSICRRENPSVDYHQVQDIFWTIASTKFTRRDLRVWRQGRFFAAEEYASRHS